MRVLKLTPSSCSAKHDGARFKGREMKRGIVHASAALLSSVGVMGLGGCINVAAPEEPIVIELNINITAEVLYRLADDANNTIDENADIF